MLRWLAFAAVISVAFSEEAAEISKGSDAVIKAAEAAPEVAQEAAESHYPSYGHRHEERERHHGSRQHEPRHHELKHKLELEPRHHELKHHLESHSPRHQDHKHHKESEKLHHQEPKHHLSHEDDDVPPAGHHRGHHDHEHRGPSVAKLLDPHHMAHHTPHGVGIVEDALSPDYIQPTWILDYRYVKTGNRDYAISDGGQVMILPEHVKNHEHKEFGSFNELLEFARLKKLAEKNAHLLHPEKDHGLGYMRSHEDRMEQMRGRMVHEHDRHREQMKRYYKH